MSRIKIVLHSDMCAGSGESLGNRVDMDICTDSYGLPYIPARRLKGCLRAAAEELEELGYSKATKENIEALFGDRYGKSGVITICDAILPGADFIHSWIESNRDSGSDAIKKAIHPERVSRIYSYTRGQTRLEKGVKVDGSLRFTNVLKHYDPMSENCKNEMEFSAPISIEADTDKMDLFKACCMSVRHIGLNRNRGLGNVSFEYIECNEESDLTDKKIQLGDSERYVLEYHVALDSSLTLPECDVIRTSVPSRSVIGVMAGRYLKKSAKDDLFDRLFLNGETIWSELTPVINGQKSYPVPMMIVKLKNVGGKLINRFSGQNGDDWKSAKPKTVESGYISFCGNDEIIADVPVRTEYHNSLRGQKEGTTGLYMQSSIDKGLIYGGTVEFPRELAEEVFKLLGPGKISFGRSRSAQYSVCHIVKTGNPEPVKNEMISISPGEPAYVVFRSDMLISGAQKVYSSEDRIRDYISEILSFENKIPEGKMDICAFSTIGGFHGMWQLQKPHIQVVKAGSIFCFTAKKETYPRSYRVGANLQEGFGLCEILSQDEMNRTSSIKEGYVDRAFLNTENDEVISEKFRSMVLANLCDELVSDNALSVSKQIAFLYKKSAVGNQKRKGIPQGRLRLLLAESESYVDLRKRIDEIKESDVDSETIGRRYECHELLDMIYGSDRNNISEEKMLGDGNNELVKEIDMMTRQRLIAEWKKPLSIALHAIHYSKGGRS